MLGKCRTPTVHSRPITSNAPDSRRTWRIGLSTTGHILEFLALAMPQQQLADPWVARATGYLCQLFRQTQDVALECGALYHAAHGLVLYRERIYGTRTQEARKKQPVV